MEMFQPHPHRSAAKAAVRSGFTLVEIMVVVVIILLMLGLAIPVLHVMTGSQSEAGASNMIAGMLGRARTDAIGLQKPIGVAFIYNPSTNVQTMAEVEFPTCPAWIANVVIPAGGYVSVTPNSTVANGIVIPSPTFYYQNTNQKNSVRLLGGPPSPSLGSEGNGQMAVGGELQAVFGPPLELKVDTGLQALPSGIAVQTICNCAYSGGTRISDGYLSVGVILFDGQGRLTSLPYGIAANSLLATSSGLPSAYPSPPGGSNVGIYSYLNGTYRISSFGVPSQFGLVVFQRNEFVSQAFPTADPAYFQQTPIPGSAAQNYTTSSSGPTQAQEEAWLDLNATPLLINRYTGTLVKGE